ncbi:alpha/beta hydrolase fold [Geodermatophilus siccatus]|uniref:Alpha/beta hydrolase fold n=1 Tax=Geodermatophilus siccatus TaxID=1137991 RepID=A0A1G9ZYD6_9ACTN|nr:alpha/beta hydrolase [Geodermatophilus siccatus]SDN26115.1 alpha/beta hydrolase fold [Geodermatophilus siccatus]
MPIASAPRLRRRIAAAACAAATSAALLAVPLGGVAVAAPAAPAPAAPAATEPPPGGVPGVPVPSITWVDAGDGFQQADVDVPYDYADPRGRTFRLHAVRLPAADPANRIGALFVNFGGPGGPAAATVRELGRLLFPPEVLARYDLVGVDPRGTGESRPVRCTGSTAEQAALPYATLADFPTDRVQEEQVIAQVRAFAEECRARNGDLLDHVRTLQFARDLDVLRAAMGDQRINLYGLSYGTFLGQVVANTFPTRTGALVLDGVVDPGWASGPPGTISWIREGTEVGSTETLDRFFELCAEAGPQQCAFAADGNPEQKYAELAARLRAAPLLVPVPDGPAEPLTYSDLVVVTAALLFTPDTWPVLGELLQEAYSADGAAVAAGLGRLPQPPVPEGYDNFPDARAAITCADTDNPDDPYRYGEVGRALDATTAPYVGSRWAYAGLVCAPWAGRSTERHTGPWNSWTRNPVLVIGNLYDPATPYRNAVVVDDLLPNSTLLTVDGVGHTSFGTSSCAASLTSQYLLTGATPPAGTVCTQDRGALDPVPASTPTGAVRTGLVAG